MLKNKDLKTILVEMSKQNGKSVSILNHALVRDGYLNMSAISNSYLTADIENVTDGFLDIDKFKKTGNLQASTLSFEESGFNPEEYPTDFVIENPKTETETEKLPPDIFSVNFQQLGNYVSTDRSRKVLNGVYFNPVRNEICAASGHVLITKKLETEFSTQFIIAPHSFKILDILASYAEGAKIIIEEKKDKKYIQIYGDGFTFTSQCLDEPYPDYNKVIPEPDSELSVTLSSDNVKQLIDGLNTLLPYTSGKTHMCVLQHNTIFCHYNNARIGVRLDQNIALNKYKDISLHIDVDVISFNTKLFLQFLQDAFTGESITLNYGPTNVYATTIQNKKQRVLIMPLRIKNKDNEYPDWLSKPIEYLDIKPIKASKKKTVKVDKVTEKLILSLQEKLGKKALIEKLKSWDEITMNYTYTVS